MGGFLGATELAALDTGTVQTTDLADGAVTTAKVADDAVTVPKLDDPTIQYAEVEIAAGAILTLNSVPVQLVAAPGNGYVLEFISALLALDYTAPVLTVVGCGDIEVRYSDAAGELVSVAEGSAWLEAAADAMLLIDKLELTTTPVNNAPLMLLVATADPAAGGNSTMHVKVAYRVHETGLV